MNGNKAALVVAAYEFQDPKFRALRSPATDVEALASVLGDEAVGGFGVKTVVNQPGPVVQRELERFFAGRRPDDLLLLYFSCHGVKDSSGKLHFATTTTEFDLLRSTGVSASFVSEQLELTRSKRVVVLLDCCYSGAFLKGFRERGDDSVSVGQLEGRGRAVITASRATEYAFEADELTSENAQPSVFTGAVVDGLGTGAADRNGDGFVTVDELYDFIYDRVRGRVAGQTPGCWVDIEGDLVIARNPLPPVRPAPLPAELQQAVDSDRALQRLGAAWSLAEWLEDPDPSRRLTAETTLRALTDDYDDRVRRAASSALSPPTTTETPSPPPDEEDPPETTGVAEATEGKQVEAAAPAEEPQLPANDATDVAEAPDAEADAGPTAGEETDVPGSEPVVAPAVGDAEAGPDQGEARWQAPDGATGRVVVAAVTTLVLGQFLPFIQYDGHHSRLVDHGWNNLWMLVFAGLGGFAAFTLLSEAGDRDVGRGLVLGLTVAALPLGPFLMGVVEPDDGEAGLGFFLVEAGFLLLVVAAALVLRATRERWHLVRPRAPIDWGLAGGGIVIGLVAALAWAELMVRYYRLQGLYLTEDAVWQITLLTALVPVVYVLLGARRHIGLPVMVAAYALAVVAPYLDDPGITTTAEGLFVMAYVMIVAGATAVPLVATALAPPRTGAVLLGGWVITSIAVWLDRSVEGDETTAGQVLLAALLAGIGLAALIARRARPATPASPAFPR